jgi:hypothetical protein
VSLEDGKLTPGMVRVSIKQERDDGQFVVDMTEVPGNLVSSPTSPDNDLRQGAAVRKISDGFVQGYQRLVGLPR